MQLDKLKEPLLSIKRYLKGKEKVIFSIVTLFISFYFLISFYSLIGIYFVFSHVSLFFEVIAILFIGIILIGVYLSIIYIRKLGFNQKIVIRILVVFCIIWLTFQFLIIGGINYNYSKFQEDYSNNYENYLIDHPNDFLNASWNITQKYYNSFSGTYAVEGAYIPNRELGKVYIPFENPIFDYYFNNMNGYQKMLVIQQKGNCGEISQAIALLLNETTHFPTRTVHFQGIDHMMPETEINDQWWVFDIDYLTMENPINSYNFSNYLDKGSRDNVANICPMNDTISLLQQHGFNETNITITSFEDIPGDSSNEKSIRGVTIEIFTLSNSHDPLVAKGVTDENGQFSTVLNSDKNYWIFATFQPLPFSQKLVGLAELSKIAPENLSINVNVTNYG
jgi:hypothetical protein